MPDPTGRLTSYADLAGVLGTLPLLVVAERRRRQISARAAARELEMSVDTLCRIEDGEDFTLSKVIRVLRWLGADHIAARAEEATDAH